MAFFLAEWLFEARGFVGTTALLLGWTSEIRFHLLSDWADEL